MRQVLKNPGGSRLRARTVIIDDPGPLEAYLTEQSSFAFLRRGEGFVALGEVARFETDSLDAADIWWDDARQEIENDTELFGVQGTGPIAVGSFAFDPDHSSDPSRLIIPEIVLGRRGGLCWMTRIFRGDALQDMPAVQPPPMRPAGIAYADGGMNGPAWESAVAEVVRLIQRGGADKVVLARDIIAASPEPIDPRWIVRHMVSEYGDCWTYLVDGLVGATPEMLIRLEGGLATSRVLAGTLRRSAPGDSDGTALAAALSTSSKDLAEHEYAVRSVAEALAPYCHGMSVPEAPHVVWLPNVMHLATDIAGAVERGPSSLALAAALHPSAAVCGTPTHTALDIINEVEGMDRGRYAGPVGWLDSTGEGEWALALRCGQIDPTTPEEIHLFAGCGIVADSRPDEELAETVAKFVPMRDALEK